MRAVLLVVGLTSCQAAGPAGLAEKVRQHADRTWEPVDDSESVFGHMSSEAQIGSLLGTLNGFPPEGLEAQVPATKDIPENFDARTQWPGCVGAVRTQGDCGACWAFAASEALSDNLCIASKGAVNVTLSVQDAVSCDKSDFGCNGGLPKNVWNFLSTTGIVTDECQPYISGPGKTNGTCASTCAGAGTYKKYKCENAKFARGFDLVKQNIVDFGPSHTVMLVYQDLLQYKTGIYSHLEGLLMGAHSVKLVGWGKEKDTEYWIVQNSWGAAWGMEGFFKIDMNDFASSTARGGGYNCGGATVETIVI